MTGAKSISVNGNIVKDLVTGEARRVDVVVIEDGKVIKSTEVTSKTAPKAVQIAKEKMIRDQGGNYIKDNESGELIPFDKGVETKIERMD